MPVAASYDRCRAKHDRAMNSSVGVGAIIGLHSSKILGYMIAGQKVPCLRDSGSQWNCATEHDCLLIGYKSSMVIEPDVVVSMVKSLQHEGIKLGALVADDVLLL